MWFVHYKRSYALNYESFLKGVHTYMHPGYCTFFVFFLFFPKMFQSVLPAPLA